MKRMTIVNALDFFGYHLCEQAMDMGFDVIAVEPDELTDEQTLMKDLFARNSLFTHTTTTPDEATHTIINAYERQSTIKGTQLAPITGNGHIRIPTLYGPFQPNTHVYNTLIQTALRNEKGDLEQLTALGEKEAADLLYAGDAAKAALEKVEECITSPIILSNKEDQAWTAGLTEILKAFETLSWSQDLVNIRGEERKIDEDVTVVQVEGMAIDEGIKRQIEWMRTIM
ncbi:hypothetical protein [Alteribacter aurantiacus]|uniref:hypothetical protein n=1 Tax=Alteribacter aurantiacus TaxID=254410 RepID=UPI0004101609|nr:hypothetical protein [Alteribacter aurantiacus]